MPRFQRSVVARAAAFLVVVLALPVSALVQHSPAGAATLPSVSIGDVSIGEGTGGTKTLTFTVTQDFRGKSKIKFTTLSDTAKAPADFVARTGSVQIAGKKLTKTIGITIVSDAIDEPDESFTVKLTGATGATIADGEATGTIMDDDAAPTVQVPATASVPEGQGGDTTVASIDVTLSAPSGREISVDWATADGTATEANSDYTGRSGTLHFAPGETDKALLIDVIGDAANEANETFAVTISGPTNATLGNATATVTIVDNDPLPTSVPIFDVDDVAKREGSTGTTTLTFTVTRSDDTTTPVTVHFAVSNGSAIAPFDYTAVAAGTLSFAASDTTKTVDVPILGDRLLEHNETLYLTLDSPSSGGALHDPQGIGTITNDDTKTAVAVKVKAAKHLVSVHGRVSPARPHKHAVVRLYRKQNGKWVRVSSKRVLLTGKTDSNKDGFTDSRYATTLKRAKKGSCRLVASYPGDSKFGASKTTKGFRC